MILIKNDQKCPKCDSSNIAQIWYGLIPYSIEIEKSINDGKIWLGDYKEKGNHPKWHCNICFHQFG